MNDPNNIKKHTDKPNLAGEYRWGDLGQIILLVIFLPLWIMDSFVFKYSVLSAGYFPLFLRIILSAVILILSYLLARAGLKMVFGEESDSSKVIKKGVFGFVRHSVYLGAILLYLGLIILTMSGVSAIFWVVIILFYNYIAIYEEKILLKQFRAEYQEYMDEVPRWIPKIIKRKK